MRGCGWCEDWADGFDPEPCPKHQVTYTPPAPQTTADAVGVLDEAVK